MEQRYLLDTNAVLDFMGKKLAVNIQKALSKIVDTEINLSVINKIELLGFSKVEQDIIDFVNYANILPINNEIVEKTIEIRKVFRIKLPDAIIAATAMVYDMTVITGNTSDFKHIVGLKLFDTRKKRSDVST